MFIPLMPLTSPSSRPGGANTAPLSAGLKGATLSAAVMSLLVTALLLVSAQPAEAASVRRVDLGSENLERLTPNCGRNFSRDCVAEGKTTIFQAKSKGIPGRTFEVPWAGKLISWSISLANATQKEITIGQEPDAIVHAAQRPFFNGIFGSPSTARIAVLKRVEKKAKGAPKYKMVRQSPIQTLNPYFGTTVTFALEKPLNVIKGQIVALTVPTWAPSLWRPRACNETPGSVLDPDKCESLLSQYSSRVSRTPRGDDKCKLGIDRTTKEPNEALAKSRAQTGVGSVRRYGCYYGPQVMLYSATVVGAK